MNDLRHKFSKSKINEIRRNLYEIEKEKNLFAPKIEEIKKNLLKLENYLYKPKMYYDYHDIEYEDIRNVRSLFDLSIDEDYYKPIITNGAFNNNYVQYESMKVKDKNLSVKEYIDVIRTYLSDIINKHKAQEKWRIH